MIKKTSQFYQDRADQANDKLKSPLLMSVKKKLLQSRDAWQTLAEQELELEAEREETAKLKRYRRLVRQHHSAITVFSCLPPRALSAHECDYS